MQTISLITAEEFARMSIDGLAELVRGEVVEMTPPNVAHGKISANLVCLLQSWADTTGRFEAVTMDAGVITERNPDSVLGPDVSVYMVDQLVDGVFPQSYLERPPLVAIEVLSPSDRWVKAVRKATEFLTAGVSEVWLVQPTSRRVHLYQSDEEPMCFQTGLTVTSPFLPGFQCSVESIFRRT